MRVEQRVGAGSIGRLVWVGPDGVPQTEPVLPLVDGGDVVVALTYDRGEVARGVADRRLVAVVLDEPRNTASGWSPLALTGVPQVAADPDGDRFTGGDLLDQELRRDPRSRRYADSAMLRREHWWYLPRLLVRVGSLVEGPAPGPRTTPADHLLLTARDGVPLVTSVRLTDPTDPAAGWRVTGGHPDPEPGPAVVAGQDASFPDLEQWAAWSWTGRWSPSGPDRGADDGARHGPDGRVEAGFAAESVNGPIGLPGPPGVVQRVRREWAFGRACRAALRQHSAP